jgi:hypothetical protein
MNPTYLMLGELYFATLTLLAFLGGCFITAVTVVAHRRAQRDRIERDRRTRRVITPLFNPHRWN